MSSPGRTVFLIGGTGDVGRRVVRLLLENSDSQIFLISRRGGNDSARTKHLAFDVQRDHAIFPVPRNSIVVNLTEATPHHLAARIVREGSTLLDTSATPDYVSKLCRAIRQTGGLGAAILSVGTAPGLTTLMASDIAQTKRVSSIDIGMELSLGRHYGLSATEWFFRTIGTRYPISSKDKTRFTYPGVLRRKISFGKSEQARLAIGVGFSELGMNKFCKETRAVGFRTFCALEPQVATLVLWSLLKLGLGPFFARNSIALAKLAMRLPAIGDMRVRIVAEGTDINEIPVTSRGLEAGDQAEVTAAIIFATINAIKTSRRPLVGLTTISQHLDFSTAVSEISRLLPSMPLKVWNSDNPHCQSVSC